MLWSSVISLQQQGDVSPDRAAIPSRAQPAFSQKLTIKEMKAERVEVGKERDSLSSSETHSCFLHCSQTDCRLGVPRTSLGFVAGLKD